MDQIVDIRYPRISYHLADSSFYGDLGAEEDDTPERRDDDREEQGQDNGGKPEGEPRPKGA